VIAIPLYRSRFFGTAAGFERVVQPTRDDNPKVGKMDVSGTTANPCGVEPKPIADNLAVALLARTRWQDQDVVVRLCEGFLAIFGAAMIRSPSMSREPTHPQGIAYA
jgi:hypothetical protein